MFSDLPKNSHSLQHTSAIGKASRPKSAASKKPSDPPPRRPADPPPKKSGAGGAAPASLVKHRPPAERMKTRHSSMESDGNSSLNSVGKLGWPYLVTCGHI